jgi:hypothetical protein
VKEIATTQPPNPAPGGPSTSPAGRLLLDPSAAALRALHAAAHLLAAALPALVGLTAASAVAGVVILAAARRRRWRAARGGRVVSILAPPEVDASGAEALWHNLHDLLRPRWRARLGGQPHLSFEYAWSAAGAHIGIWAPESVPPGMVERAVEAAWPAARTQTAPVSDASTRGGELNPLFPGSGTAVAGGELRLAQPEWFPIRTEHDADPLRAVMGAAAPARDGESAVV